MASKRSKIIIYPGFTDLRKGVYSLQNLCKKKIKDSDAKRIYCVFCNSHRTNIKVLVICKLDDKSETRAFVVQERSINFKKQNRFEWYPNDSRSLSDEEFENTVLKLLERKIASYGFVV